MRARLVAATMIESQLAEAQDRLTRILNRADACIVSMDARRRLAKQAEAALRRRTALA